MKSPLSRLITLIKPPYIGGYRVNYNSPIYEPCPECGGQTFRSYEDREIACCTGCLRALNVFDD